ncbi:MAG: hypothetical protein JST58_20860 [Bacteroidetes bacterium]|nr:hypothetical protein [Bacteroidota bacterium]
MKNIILGLCLFLADGTMGFAQCGQKLALTSSKTVYLDSTGIVQRNVDEQSTIELSPTTLSIAPGNDPVMTGAVQSENCNWTIPFKEGKSIYKVLLNPSGGADPMNLTVTIEGKDGKITFLAEMEQMPDRRIMLLADTFEEKQ